MAILVLFVRKKINNAFMKSNVESVKHYIKCLVDNVNRTKKKDE